MSVVLNLLISVDPGEMHFVAFNLGLQGFIIIMSKYQLPVNNRIKIFMYML